MPLHPADRDVIDRYFRAMQAGESGQDDLLALFTEDAVYIEPFTDGEPRAHHGKDAIRAALHQSRGNTPPDLKLTVERVDLDGDHIRSDWVCESPIFPSPMRGSDRYLLRDGKIARLEVTLAQ